MKTFAYDVEKLLEIDECLEKLEQSEINQKILYNLKLIQESLDGIQEDILNIIKITDMSEKLPNCGFISTRLKEDAENRFKHLVKKLEGLTNHAN